MKVAVIPADGDVRFEDVPRIDLDYLQSRVGGHIEALRIPGTGINLYLNEEGKLLGLAVNERADAIAWRTRAVSFSGVIVGDVVVVGPVDEQGNDTGLSEEQVAWLKKELSVDEIMELLRPDPWGPAATKMAGQAAGDDEKEEVDE